MLNREKNLPSRRLRTGSGTIRFWLVCRVAAAVAVAAGAAGAIAATASASSHGKKLKSITFVNPLPNYPAWHEIGACMAKEAKTLGIPFTQSGPGGSAVNTQFMVTRIDQAVADKVGALITFPISAPQFDPLFAQARKAGIYVATVEGAGSTKNQNFDAGTSYTEFGRLAAKTVAEKKGTQYIGFIEPNNTPPASTFVNAFTNAAKKYSNIKIVTTQYDQGNPTNDVDLATNMMTANPQLNMIVTNEGAATSGVISAIKSSNNVGKVFLTTNSIYSGAVQGFQEGIVYSTLLQDMCAIGRTPVQEIAALAEGKKVPKEIPTPILFATKSDYKKLTKSGQFQ